MRLRFEVPVPTSSKNSRQLVRTKAGGMRSLPSTRARMAKQVIAAAAFAALLELGIRPEAVAGPDSLFGPDDDIAVRIIHRVAAGTVLVEIWSCGPKPKAPTGRGRDIDNFASTILDALNGVAYGDDRQVALLQVERSYDD